MKTTPHWEPLPEAHEKIARARTMVENALYDGLGNRMMMTHVRDVVRSIDALIVARLNEKESK